MEWFGVKILMKHILTGTPVNVDSHYSEDDVFFEESLRLVLAENFEDAEHKAKQLAKDNEFTFQNVYRQTVSVSFYDVVDVYYIGETPAHGVEVYSGIFKVPKDFEVSAIAHRFVNCEESEMYTLRNRECYQTIGNV